MLIKKGRFYRLLTLTVAFVVLGMAAFLPLLANKVEDDSERIPVYIALGIYCGVFLLLLIGNEIYIAIRKRKENGTGGRT